jgi:hypothetical protein
MMNREDCKYCNKPVEQDYDLQFGICRQCTRSEMLERALNLVKFEAWIDARFCPSEGYAF